MMKGTVCFLTKNEEVLLILIEYSPTDRKWTGIGGYSEEGESLEDAVIRESKEESHIAIEKECLKKVAELTDDALQLHVFLTDKWSGKLKAKDPTLKEFRWFPKNNLPFSQMHKDNDKWLPQVLNGKLVKKVNDQFLEVNELN